MNLRSDNNAGLIPEARAGLLAAAEGDAIGYGDDPFTARAVAALRALFGAATEVFFVATGTAANTLAIAALSEPWQRVLCHRESHWYEDESTAPERITLCRSTPISPRHDPTRIAPDDLEPVLARPGGVHHPTPGVLTLTNTTEFGTLYSPAQLAALASLAHAHDYRVHIDGARFANAVAHLVATSGSTPPRPVAPSASTPASTPSRSAAPRPASPTARRSSCSRRSPPPPPARPSACPSCASRPATCSANTASSPAPSPTPSRTTPGCATPSTPTPWRSGSPPAWLPEACPPASRARPTPCSPSSRPPSTPTCAPAATATTPSTPPWAPARA
ncbi:MAG: hypothetical protein IPO88_26605 [Nannocystis sp.]|uniref:threonine aldolase family protein n=1 Tax=Nannocystis sp. TaxID=1962667 RepID=UPI002422BBCD|nr:beta-eliminating lyase-related protein [Nannocystis sp.]MBK9757001.1 hypothetical protein [Nannocystis sp.]